MASCLNKNFKYLLDSLDCSSVDIFNNEILQPYISRAPSEKWETVKKTYDMDIKTMRKLRNDENYVPSKNIVITFSQWFKVFLNIEVKYDVLSTTDLSKDAINWTEKQIEGHYIGTYLDATASGEIKALYLEIKKDEHENLRAYVIHNLRDIDFGEDQEAFLGMDIESKYSRLKRRGSQLLEGTVKGRGNTVVIEVVHKGGSRHKMTLFFDISNYLRFCKESEEERYYKGGLGLQVVLDDIRVTSPYVTRIGLIRTDSCTHFSMKDEQIKQFLAVTPHETPWGPLRLNLDRDSLWFEFFMRVHEESFV